MPEVSIRFKQNVQVLECLGPDCEWRDWAETVTEAVEMKNEHREWHLEGKQP